MEIDIAGLAAQVAAFLAPYLPYLVKGGKIAAKKAFEKAGEKFAEKGWEGAEKLWKKLKPKMEAKPAAQDAVEEFIKDPADEDALPSLRKQIKRILAEDTRFAEEVSITIGGIDFSSIQTGDRSIVVKRDMEDSTATTGDKNIVATHGGQITSIATQNNTTIGTQINADQVVMQTGGENGKAKKVVRPRWIHN
ncbi:hypothetical protein FBQ81_12485 [Chloroflexi bacterium CFX6]|nr:hypothetical protein [Chloroflexi bacterium CFX6]